MVERSITAGLSSSSNFKLYYSLQMFFNNGGGHCYIISVVDIETHNENSAAATVNPLSGTLSALKSSEPSLYRIIIAETNKIYVELSPPGAVAGIYARVDRERGVWKAPANVGVIIR